MKLKYKATASSGKITEGIIDAKSVEEAAYYLRGKDMLPISIQELHVSSISLPFLNRRKSSDLVLFTRQLSSMLTSGLTVIQSLSILKEQLQNQNMKEIVGNIISDIQEGKTFAEAISKYPDLFTPIYVSLVRAAESSGFLDKILLRLADNLEKQQKLKGTIRSALMYPIMIVSLMIIVMGIMMVVVIPQLTVLYQQLNIPLPFTTEVVITISNFTTNFWPLVIGLIFLTFFVYNRWRHTDSGELVMDSIMLKLPVFGKLIEQSILVEFSRTFGLLVGAGTLVVQSLHETADVAGNRIYKQAILEIANRVEKGVTIGDAMQVYPIFPPILVQMVKIGEQTGKVDDSLLKVSEYFEREVDLTVKTLTTAMEPIIMIVLGVMVAFLIISIITPIYNLTSNIQ